MAQVGPKPCLSFGSYGATTVVFVYWKDLIQIRPRCIICIFGLAIALEYVLIIVV